MRYEYTHCKQNPNSKCGLWKWWGNVNLSKHKYAFGIIILRRENGTWKLKGTVNLKKSPGDLIAPFHHYFNWRRGATTTAEWGITLCHLPIIAVFTTYSFQKYGLITYHLVKASASEERAQIPIVDVDPAFCIFTPSSSVLCRKKKLSVIPSFSVGYYYLIPPPFWIKCWIVLAARNAIRPEEALFPPSYYIGVISDDYLLVICGTGAKEVLPATTLQAAFGTLL